MTEAGLPQKLKTPKFTETFVKKLRMLAEKYELQDQPIAGSASTASGSSSEIASGSGKVGGEKGGASSGKGKASKGETNPQKRTASLPHATAHAADKKLRSSPKGNDLQICK